jgi:hypothetical protein
MARVLGVDAISICCVQDSFYDLGGTSVTSLQFVFALQRDLEKALKVQDLFRAPTVAGVCASLSDVMTDSSAHAETAAEVGDPELQLLTLSQGQSGRPLLLFNPAGASGLCYLELSQRLGTLSTVLVFDDGVVSSGTDLLFSSIQAVAVECVAELQRREESGVLWPSTSVADVPTEIVLAGWSYGGVVAVEVARLLAAKASAQDGSTLPHVVTVCLFDSPLSAPSSAHYGSDEDEGDAVVVAEGLSGPSLRHFGQCTALLNAYHGEAADERFQLSCDVLHVLPSEGPLGGDPAAAATITSGVATNVTGPGTHWTLLSGEGAKFAAALLEKILRS